MTLHVVAVDQGSQDNAKWGFSLHGRVFTQQTYNLDILSDVPIPAHSNAGDLSNVLFKLYFVGYMFVTVLSFNKVSLKRRQ